MSGILRIGARCPFIFGNFGPSLYANISYSTANQPGRLALSDAMIRRRRVRAQRRSEQRQPWHHLADLAGDPGRSRDASGKVIRGRVGSSHHRARMTTPLTVRIPHQLGRAEARRRIETGFAKMIDVLPGGAGRCSERWDGDRLVFSVAAMAQTVAGVIDVVDTTVTMEIELPGVLGLIASGLKDRLQKAGQLLLTKK